VSRREGGREVRKCLILEIIEELKAKAWHCAEMLKPKTPLEETLGALQVRLFETQR